MASPSFLPAGRLNLEIRTNLAMGRQMLILVGAALIGILVSAAILVAAGVPFGELLSEFVIQTLLDPASRQAVLAQAGPLVLVGLAGSVAFRTRFWNLGLEGQMIWGSIAATALSVFDFGPPGVRLPLMLAAAATAGLAWSGLAFYLKERFRVNEIISTLLLNYVALYLLLDLLYGAWQDPKDSFPHSPQFRDFERLPDWGWPIHGELLLALLATVAVFWLLSLSRFGLYIRFVHENKGAARALGVPVRAVMLASVLLSGALAGWGGFIITDVQEGRLTQSFFDGYGFSGILIAFLARNNPLAAAMVAVLIAVLFVTGQSLQIFYQIPFSMVQLIEAIIVMTVAASEFLIRHRLRWVA
ncbi:ABC transporter permease [Telmatospirillum siberiense]|uniref:ABC transporter permease n=1 Tax=Telmatospirillum siberiense TaxID=382514 RepID=A0A2N3PSR4_9PROT|nr:ABC transporter permease [Telmatospirillum siberiense]PKU23445.1 ABC transporter permease [Telmatospirillum siberiense]